MNTITIPISVNAVTVYPDRARVSCAGKHSLPAGIQTLLVDDLPLTLLPDSIRATGVGKARVRIMGIDLTRQNYALAPAGNIQQLEEEIRQLDDQLRELNDQQAGLNAQNQYLDGMRQATNQYAKGLAQGRSTVEEQAKLLSFLAEQDQEIRAGIRAIDKQKWEISQLRDKLKRDLAQLQSQRPRQRYQAKIEAEVLSEGEFELKLIYVVNQASWHPLYDLRLTDEEGENKLQVSYIAQVTQRTGQDWRGVQLTLSTARPALTQRLPELHPWYIDQFRPQPRPQQKKLRQTRMMSAAAPARAEMAADVAAFAEEEPISAEIVQAEVGSSGSSVHFTAGGKIDIPTDGSPHKTTLQLFDLPFKLDYLTVPKHTDAIYRRATVTNGSAGPLLAGNASLFVNEEFIGTTRLNFTAREEEFELLLGVEERMTVSRELTKRDVDKKLLRDNRQARFGYQIEIENLLSMPANITIQDHFPVSRHERIKVKLEKTSPNSSKQSELNELEWTFSLSPNDKKIIQYEFSVEHPAAMEIAGLHI